jgi:hypothetical protein
VRRDQVCQTLALHVMEMYAETPASVRLEKRDRRTPEKDTGSDAGYQSRSTSAVSSGTAPESMDEAYPGYSESWQNAALLVEIYSE